MAEVLHPRGLVRGRVPMAPPPTSLSYLSSTSDSPLADLTVFPRLLSSRSTDSLATDVSSTILNGFPESLEQFRQEAKKSNDPWVQLDFVEYLLECSNKIAEDPSQLGINLPPTPPGEPNSNEERRLTMRKLLEAEALRWLKKLASSGRQPLAEAQFLLAEYYGKGLLSLAVDHTKAFSLYVQASKQSHPTATYRAAVCYEVGAGTKRDNTRAVQFYRKAAALGDHLAMHKLALILLYGKMNQKKNLKEGITWLKRAANAATEVHPEALHDLAQCYEKKGGCPVLIPDEHYSFELYARAAQYGFAPSQYRLGTCYEYGLLGCQVDPSSSIKWYSKAAEQGFPDAELALSCWYLSGSHGVLQQSDTDAFLWAKKAADRSHPKAMYQVGNYCEIGIGVSSSMEEATKWYGLSAAKGYKRAAQRLLDIKKANKKKAPGKCLLL